jgi:hypothetical protein
MKIAKHKTTTLVLVLLLLSTAGNIYLYKRYTAAENKNPDIQTERIVKDLQAITTVPDETPSVLTVVDKSKLSDSTIAKNADNGDKILLFQKASKVYIYRPSSKKLITILSLNTTQPSTKNAANNPATTPSGTTPSR